MAADLKQRHITTSVDFSVSAAAAPRTHLALVLGGGLTHERRVVDEAVLGRVFAGLQGPEKSLLGTEDLHRGGRVLRQIQQGP